MVREADKNIILRCAKKYKVKEIILFGSSLQKDNAADIDLGIKGIEPGSFFKFYGELLLALSKPVDVVDLTKENSFNRMIEKEGVKLYG